MELPDGEQIYRYWVELRDLRDGSARDLPLRGLKKIHLPTKKGAPHLPDEVVLEVEDGAELMEARDIDDLATQLRLKYPDGAFERFLRRERDREAEERKAEAMEGLIRLLAKAALDDLLREQGSDDQPYCDEPHRKPIADGICLKLPTVTESMANVSDNISRKIARRRR